MRNVPSSSLSPIDSPRHLVRSIVLITLSFGTSGSCPLNDICSCMSMDRFDSPPPGPRPHVWLPWVLRSTNFAFELTSNQCSSMHLIIAVGSVEATACDQRFEAVFDAARSALWKHPEKSGTSCRKIPKNEVKFILPLRAASPRLIMWSASVFSMGVTPLFTAATMISSASISLSLLRSNVLKHSTSTIPHVAARLRYSMNDIASSGDVN
mmetsp:Transcript_88326/g.252717  ORF Transcript_88326/g.252717 Transcript_88326/m.252717 type:complete len:210 (+) Transcript_88326:1846-2475(+)